MADPTTSYERRVRYNEIVSSVGVHPSNHDMYRLSRVRHYAIPTLALNRLLVSILAQSRNSLLEMLERLKASVAPTESGAYRKADMAGYTDAVIREVTRLAPQNPIKLNELELYNLYSCSTDDRRELHEEDSLTKPCVHKPYSDFYADSCTDLAIAYRLPYAFDEKLDAESLHGPYLSMGSGSTLVSAVSGVRALPTTNPRFAMFKSVLYKCVQLDRQTGVDDRVLARLECVLDDALGEPDYVNRFLSIDLPGNGYCHGLARALAASLPEEHRTERNVNYTSLLYFLGVDYNSSLLKCKPKLTRADCEYIFKRIAKGAPEAMAIDRCAFTVNQLVKCFPEVGSYTVQVYTHEPDDEEYPKIDFNETVIHLLSETRAFDQPKRPDLMLSQNSTHGTVVTFGSYETDSDRISSDEYCAIMDYAKTVVDLTFRFGKFEVLQLALQLAPYNIKDATNVHLTMTRTKGDIDTALVLKALWETLMGKTCDLSYIFNILCKKYTRMHFDKTAAANALIKFVLFDCNRIANLPVDASQARYAYESVRGYSPEMTLYYATFFKLKELELAKLYHSTDESERTDEFIGTLKALYITSVCTSALGKRLINLLNFEEPLYEIEQPTGRLPFAIPSNDSTAASLQVHVPSKTSISSELEYRIYADYYINTRDSSIAHLL